ncbi:MAG: hypothetical protein IMW93_00665 [Thermoanaerobacteraceae bacterium]|nr:hypothetical protein [Thermoanaerobacteraceae bacterium]
MVEPATILVAGSIYLPESTPDKLLQAGKFPVEVKTSSVLFSRASRAQMVLKIRIMGVRWGVKETSTFLPARALNSCSISGVWRCTATQGRLLMPR